MKTMKNYVLVYVPQKADGTWGLPKCFTTASFSELEYYQNMAGTLGWKVLTTTSYYIDD